jgi:hypothetical protein
MVLLALIRLITKSRMVVVNNECSKLVLVDVLMEI